MIRYIRELCDARVVIEADTSDEIVSLLEKLDVEKTDKMLRDDGWIEWNGGAQPVPDDTRVEYVMTFEGPSQTDDAGNLRWDHKNLPGDIIKYRVAK